MDLLDLAQMEQNTFKLNKDFFSIFDAIEQAFSVVKHIAERKLIKLILPVCTIEESILFEQIYGDKNRLV